MKRLSFTVAIASFSLLLAHTASAQTTCPKSEEGSACDGGQCLSASCTFADGHGGTTESACGLCVMVGPGECIGSDAGPACPTGTTCNIGSVAAGGGSTGGGGGGSPEAGTVVSFGYSIGQCEGPRPDASDDSGEEGDDASANDDDAGALGVGSDVDGGVVPKDAGLTTKDASADHDTSSSGSSGGCGIASSTPATTFLPLAAVLGLALIRRRRARR